MTENTTKVRALILAALMVFSVFAGTVALSGSVAAANQEELEDDGYTYYSSYTEFTDESLLWGQQVAIDGFDGESPVLTEDEGDDGTRTVEELSPDEDGVVTFDTSELESGDYFLETSSTDASDGTVEVIPMDLSADFADDSVQNDEPTEVEFDSNRGTYDVNVSADGDLSNEELADIFGEDVEGADADNDEVTLTDVSDGAVEADFDGIDTGDYEFDFESTDTSAESSDSINVTEAGEGDANFANATVVEQQGDIAEITVDLEETTDGTLVIGSEDDNYRANVSLVDDDEDGQVTVLFNSYLAGQNNADIISAEGDDEATLENAGEDVQDLTDILDSGDYDLRVSPADGDSELDDETDISTLVIEERSTDGMTLWRVSDGNAGDLEDADDVSAAVEDDLVTETDMIAGEEDGDSDILVHQISASGLEGLLDDTDLTDALDEELGMSIEETEDSVGANAEPKEVIVSDSDSAFSLVQDGENDEYYIVFDLTEATIEQDGDEAEFEDGDEFESEFSVEDNLLLGIEEQEDVESDDHETVNSTWDFEAAEGSFDDPTNVTASEDAMIDGETNIAPGSELTVEIRSDDGTEPRFINTESAVVQSDGTFNGTFDLSDNAAGDEFTVSASSTYAAIDDADGNIVESVGTETATPETETATATATATDEPGTDTATATDEPGGDDTDTDEPDDDTTTTDTPGFGIAVALVALLAAALLAGRRE